MSTTRKRILQLVPFVAIVAAIGAAGASASRPSSATGTVGNTSAVFNSVTVVHGNLIVDLSATAAYTGTFSGTSAIHGVLIVRPDGSAKYHDVEVFTGTVNGVPGTVTFDLKGSNDSQLAVHATARIVSASGGLAGLHGVLHEVGTVVFPTGPVGTYRGQIQSDDR